MWVNTIRQPMPPQKWVTICSHIFGRSLVRSWAYLNCISMDQATPHLSKWLSPRLVYKPQHYIPNISTPINKIQLSFIVSPQNNEYHEVRNMRPNWIFFRGINLTSEGLNCQITTDLAGNFNSKYSKFRNQEVGLYGGYNKKTDLHCMLFAGCENGWEPDEFLEIGTGIFNIPNIRKWRSQRKAGCIIFWDFQKALRHGFLKKI